LAAGHNSFALLVPFDGFLLAVGYLVSNCDLRCIVALAGIAAYLVIRPITWVRIYAGLTIPYKVAVLPAIFGHQWVAVPNYGQ
jgi:hypothetical protein